MEDEPVRIAGRWREADDGRFALGRAPPPLGEDPTSLRLVVIGQRGDLETLLGQVGNRRWSWVEYRFFLVVRRFLLFLRRFLNLLVRVSSFLVRLLWFLRRLLLFLRRFHLALRRFHRVLRRFPWVLVLELRPTCRLLLVA